jgi:two-component system sensor histidine kinase/response regulator
VLTVSSRDDAESRERAFSLGSDAHLGGQITTSALADALVRMYYPSDSLGASSIPADGEKWGRLRGLRVLVVEDNEVNRQILEELLALVGVETVSASDGASALRRLHGSPPDTFSLVLMDVQMPGMDGYETTRRLRQDVRYEALPIVALTAHALAEEREHSLAAGMVDHLTKPIVPDALYRVIADYGRPAGRGLLDSPDALARVQGNVVLYRDLLRRFTLRHTTIHAVRSDLAAGRVEDALARLHQLRGLGANLGLRALARLLDDLETVVKAGERSTGALFEAAERTLTETLEVIRAYLGSAVPPVAAPKPDEGQLGRVMARARALVLAHDTDAGGFVADHRSLVALVLGDGRARELSSALEEFDFRRALTLIDQEGP